MAKLLITYVKSTIGYSKDQKKTIQSLGLRKLNSFALHNDTPAIRGMAFKVRHLVRVEEVSDDTVLEQRRKTARPIVRPPSAIASASEQAPEAKPAADAEPISARALPKTGDPSEQDLDADLIRHYTTLRDTARQNGGIAEEIHASAYLAHFTQAKGDLSAARRHLGQAMEKSISLPDEHLRGILLGQRGLLEYADSRLDQALANTLEALAIFIRLDMPERERAIQNLAVIRAAIPVDRFTQAWTEALSRLSQTDRAALDIPNLLIQTGPPRHVTNIQFPERCQINQIVPLQVQLPLRELTEQERQIDEQLRSYLSSTELTVHVSSSAFDIDAAWRPLVLPFDKDSDRIQFDLTGRDLGQQIIHVQFFYDTARVGYTVIETEIVPGDTAGIDKQFDPTPFDDRNLIIGKGETQLPDVTIFANLSHGRVELSYKEKLIRGRVDAGCAELKNEEAVPPTSTKSGGKIETDVVNMWSDLHQEMAAIMQMQYPDPIKLASIRQRFEGLCATIGQTFLTTKLRSASQNWAPGSTITISSDQHWIPWELIFDGDYWGRKFIIARDPVLKGDQDTQLKASMQEQSVSTYLSKVVNVIGSSIVEGKPRDTDNPEKLFDNLKLKEPLVTCKHPRLQISEVTEAMQLAEIVHFTCHGTINPSALLLGDKKSGHTIYALRPSDIIKCTNIRDSIIFANACFSGVTPSTINEYRNFGLQFYLKDVAVYIGALGKIPINEATQFARRFYQLVWQCVPVGEALRQTKIELSKINPLTQQMEDPFPMLYIIYGDPFARKIPDILDRLSANQPQ